MRLANKLQPLGMPQGVVTVQECFEAYNRLRALI
jgi:hypothetical protein